MTRSGRRFLLLMAGWACSTWPAPSALAGQTLPRVFISTEMGKIVVEVDTVRAPLTARNFLRYVDEGFYDGGSFYRTVREENQPDDSVRIEVIQAGISPARRGDTYGPIPLERTSETGVRHVDGSLSMARAGPNTAVASFFICVGHWKAVA